MNVVAGIAATGAGPRLRAAREARGLDIQQIANELRLPARHLEAIEAEDAGKLPGPSFTCAYLRKYSAFLQVPSDAIVESFPGMPEYLASVRSTVMQTKLVANFGEPEVRETAQEPRVTVSTSTVRQKIPGVDRSSIILVSIAAVVAIWLIARFLSGDEKSPAAPTPSATEAQAETPVPVQEAPVSTEPPVAVQQPLGEVMSPTPVVAPTVAESNPVLPPLPPMAEITFKFRDDSWLEVNDATGTRLAFELGRGGQSRTLRGPAPFRVMLGVAGNVEIRYSEQDFDMSPYRDREFIEMHIGRAEDNRVPSN